MIYVSILLLNALDLAITLLAVRLFGAYELNALFHGLIWNNWVIPLKMSGATVSALTLYFLERRFPQFEPIRYAACFILGIYFTVVYHNGMLLAALLRGGW